MRIEITSKNYNVSEKLKAIIEKKVGRLDKYFNDDAVAKVNCRQEGNLNKLELTVRSKGLFYRAEVFKKKTFELEPISVEDAKVFLDTIDNNFYIFLNRETNKVNVLYKRLDNNFGLIEVLY